MARLLLILVWCEFILHCSYQVNCSTHWVVTEDGRIQSQSDSLFNLRRPDDLVALLKQEERSIMLDDIKMDLLQRKEEIDKNEDKDTGLEQRFYKLDSDCIIAGKPLPEFDLYISTVLPLENKGIRPGEHIDFNAPRTSPRQLPYCYEVIDLDFSMHVFEHLEGMKDRRNLTGTPELGLKNAITLGADVDDYGHLIWEALQKNHTSWVLYNMAAFFWRIKGDHFNVVECLRRALHFSPRMQKDVALISLANVFHRSRYSNEAAILVHAALEVSRELNVNHFTLGNIYAVLADYNKSVICFENTLKIQPDFEAAAERKHAVLCHAKLESALEAQHRSLQRTLNELRDYQKKHEYWQIQQEKLLSEQASSATKFEQRVAFERHKIQEELVQMGEICQDVLQDGRRSLKCTWGRKKPIDLSWHFHYSGTKGGGLSSHSGGSSNLSRPTQRPRYIKRIERAPEELEGLSWNKEDWPSKDECDTFVQKFPQYNEFPTTYLPPENKGFVPLEVCQLNLKDTISMDDGQMILSVKTLLSSAQGLKEGMQHPLPWYPPVCTTQMNIPESTKSYDHIPAVKERNKSPTRLADPSMKPVLLALVDGPDVTEEEVGQRIFTAIKQDIGPSWLLYNLAGLYWRIIGNNVHGIECIRRSLYLVPDKYKDVPLVNLANMLYKWGRVDDAVTIMRDAIQLSDLEPETHFFLGNMLSAKGNLTGAIWHYEEALNQNLAHIDAFNMLRILKCYLKFHRNAQSAAPKESSAPCCNKGSTSPTVKKVESKINCKNMNSQETCVVEMTAQPGSCRGSICQQTCTVAPIKVEMCAGGEADGMCTKPTNNINTQRPPGQAPGVPHNQDGCPASSPSINPAVTQQLGTDTDMDRELTVKLDEISEHYRSKGICEGDECQQLMVQCVAPVQTEWGVSDVVTQHQLVYRSAAMLDYMASMVIDGILHQKLIFVNSPTDIVAGPDDCIIYNDGSKTPGCTRDEFKPFNMRASPDLTFPGSNHANNHGNDMNNHNAGVHNILLKCRHPADDTSGGNPMCTQISATHYTDEEIIRINPDPSRHLQNILAPVHWPTWNECKENYRKIDFSLFTSSWVSPSIKGIDLADYIDFDEVITSNRYEGPECSRQSGDSLQVLEMLDSVVRAERLKYGQEDGLRDMLEQLNDDDSEDVEVVGTRIARALKKKPTSWVLNNIAALYWRVYGSAEKAISCIKMAYDRAPAGARNIALLSLTNILHKAGRFDEALLVINMALEADPMLVTTHFNLANIYAAKGDMARAVPFYESTLTLQSKFPQARTRLQSIQCEKILSNPHIYNNPPKK